MAAPQQQPLDFEAIEHRQNLENRADMAAEIAARGGAIADSCDALRGAV